MKHKILLSVMSLILVFGLYIPAAYSQNPTYNAILAHDQQMSSTVYQFDIYLLRTGTTPFELGGCQFGFTYTVATLNGGHITAAWLAGTSDLDADQQFGALNTATSGVIKCASRNIPSSGTIISSTGLGSRVGTLQLTNTVDFSSATLNITYTNITGSAYNTVILALVGGLTVHIEDPASDIYDASFTNPTLPVELTSFVSNVNGRQVNLTWETKTEINFNKYEIERALVSTKDATVTWTSVGTVLASGTSSSSKKYSYTEKNLQAGKYQYRLKIIDNDGSFKFSDVIETTVALPKSFDLSQNYPNPFNPTTKINYQVPVDAKVIMEVYNITGQKVMELVNQQQSAGFYTVDFGSSKLSSGVYIYRLVASDLTTGNNFSSIKKMMLLK